MSDTSVDYSGGFPSLGGEPTLPTRGVEKFLVTFDAIPENISERMNDSILSCSVNYSMDMVTELTLRIIDRDYTNAAQSVAIENSFAAANYFNIGRDVRYVTRTILSSSFDETTKQAKVELITLLMEVAEISVDQENSISPIWTVKCRTKAIQQMKRDKKPESIEGNGTDYVRRAATKFGLKFIGEKTDKSKKINKATGDNEADSVWTVIQNLAQQAKFKCFEVDGTLYFGSMKWLMYKWGSDAIRYTQEVKNPKTQKPETKKVTRRYVPLVPGEVGQNFQLQKLPNMRKSDNDPMEASGSATIDRTNGVSLRPGMTVFVGGIPTFVGYYLITAVDFEERSPNPVGIQFQTPERKPKEKIVNLPVGPMFPSTGDPVGPDVLVPYIKYGRITPQDTGNRRRP